MKALRGALLDWYQACGRDLPWRGAVSPYEVLVSEFMLQQTRVETVLRFYEPFLRRFPAAEVLAAAHEEDVLRQWQGLGYYRRARHLRAAARVVRDRCHGRVPSDVATLRTLPGVGPYMAGAVASIAYGRRVAAVDGNALRVFSRLFDLPVSRPAQIARWAGRLVPAQRPGDWNQAVMDLAATVCLPRQPRCGICPWRAWCRARQRGTWMQRPVPLARKPPARMWRPSLVRLRVEGRAAGHWDGSVWLERRPKDGLLGGLAGFPGLEMPETSGAAADLPQALAAAQHLPADRLLPLPELAYSHVFTHRRWAVRPFLLLERAPQGGAGASGAGAAHASAVTPARGPSPSANVSPVPARDSAGAWVPLAVLRNVALPRAFEPIRRWLLEAGFSRFVDAPAAEDGGAPGAVAPSGWDAAAAQDAPPQTQAKAGR